jgi:transcriptional regulator with XRE-family HTH domain
MAEGTRITQTQCRVARDQLGWSQQDLAQKANVDKGTIAKFEVGERTPIPANMEKIIKTLEEGGAVWIPAKEGGYEATASRKWGMPEAKPKKRSTSASSEGMPIVIDKELADH